MLVFCGLAFYAMNALSTVSNLRENKEDRLSKYITSGWGSFLLFGIGSIIFGFLDNFGMKLGLDALEGGSFWKMSEGVMSYASDTKKRAEMKNALKHFNNMLDVGAENQHLRNAWTSYKKTNDINDSIEYKELVSRYKGITDAAAMLGNTFSDGIGALMGAGISGIFTYLTCLDGDAPNPDAWQYALQNPAMKVLLEALFIVIGCLIPVMMHFVSLRANKECFGEDATVRTPSFVMLCLVLLAILGSMVVVVVQEKLKPDDYVDSQTLEDNQKDHINAWSTGVATVILLIVLIIFLRKFEIEKTASDVQEAPAPLTPFLAKGKSAPAVLGAQPIGTTQMMTGRV